MQKLSIDVTKIDKSEIFEGKKGKYINLTLFENKGGTDQYGNDGFIIQEISQKRREAGEKGPILGNWKHVGQSSAGRDRTPQDAYRKPQDAHNAAKSNGFAPASEGGDFKGDDDIPF